LTRFETVEVGQLVAEAFDPGLGRRFENLVVPGVVIPAVLLVLSPCVDSG
jgi:hypothetical protein